MAEVPSCTAVSQANVASLDNFINKTGIMSVGAHVAFNKDVSIASEMDPAVCGSITPYGVLEVIPYCTVPPRTRGCQACCATHCWTHPGVSANTRWQWPGEQQLRHAGWRDNMGEDFD
jgi:hypothetical protein